MRRSRNMHRLSRGQAWKNEFWRTCARQTYGPRSDVVALGLGGACAAIAVVAIASGGGDRNKPTQTPQLRDHPSTAKQAPLQPDWHIVMGIRRRQDHCRVEQRDISSARETVAANPKLDLFPSPLPLSDRKRFWPAMCRSIPTMRLWWPKQGWMICGRRPRSGGGSPANRNERQ